MMVYYDYIMGENSMENFEVMPLYEEQRII